MQCRHDSRLAGFSIVLVLSLAGGAGPAASSRTQSIARGVVVEGVARNSAGDKAGIKPGDVLLSWVRAAAPPANPDEARGEIGSPFDLVEIETEQAPRGEIRLSGSRSGAALSVVMPPGAWTIAARPSLPEPQLTSYQEGRRLIAAKEIGKGVETWRALAGSALASSDVQLAAWLHFKVGDALASARRWDEAHAGFQAALEALNNSDRPIIVAIVWDATGTAFERQSELSKAAGAYQEALRIHETNAAGTLAAAASLMKLGAVAFARGDLPAAEAYFRRSLIIRETLSPETLGVAASLTSLGAVARNRDDFLAAEKFHMRSLAIREKLAPDSLGLATTLSNLGVVAAERDDFSAAEEFFRRSLVIRETLAPGGLDVAASLTGLGNVAIERGDLAAGEAFLKRSLAIKESLAPESSDTAASLNNLAVVAGERGDLAAAEELLRRALAIKEKRAPESLDVASTLSNLGNVIRGRGDLIAAEALLRRALAIKEKGEPDTLSLAVTLNNLGNIASDRGDWAAADALNRRSLAIQERRAPESLEIARSLTNLAGVAAGRGELVAAEELLKRSLAIKEKLAPNSLVVATTLAGLAEIASNRGDLTASERHFEASLAIQQRLAPGSTGEAKALRGLGSVARATNRHAAAADYFERAIGSLEAQTGKLGGAEEIRSGFAAQYAGYYKDYVELLLTLEQPALAFHVLERSRARSLLAMLAERDLAFVPDLPADLARERMLTNADYDRTQSVIARLHPANDAAEIDRLLTRLRELRDQRERISDAVRKASPHFASVHYPQPLDLASAQKSLDEGTLLLAYCVTKDKTFLFVVQPGGRPLLPGTPPLSVFTLAIGESVLRDKVAALRRLIERNSGAEPGTMAPLSAAARELFDTLVGPAHALIAASNRVLISPDGPLHTLPFGVLVQPSGSSSRYLVEWKPLHIVASATLYAELQKERRTAAASPSLVLAAFGDPRYPTLPRHQPEAIANPEVRAAVRNGFALEPLPASRKEVEGIARLFAERATSYLGEEATEERAKSIGRGPRYLHFATHGVLDERFPLNSALALTIPERPGDGQPNGLLQAWEIFEQVRIDADLVTLSACGTALGKELGGEGLLGLTRAFHYAGARSVLASLWSVGDESTAELMTRFYGHLKDGDPKDEALRAAQIELIRMRGPLAHPFHWAAFQLSGDWK